MAIHAGTNHRNSFFKIDAIVSYTVANFGDFTNNQFQNRLKIIETFDLKKVSVRKLCCAILLMASIAHSNILLEKPKLIDSARMAEIAAEWETCFTWGLGMGCNFICTYKEGSAGFLIQAFGVPIRSSNFPYYGALKEIISSYRQPQGQGGYYVAEPLKVVDQTPAPLGVDELCHYLKEKTFIFYTGAGISASGKVATMNDLMQALKMDWNNRLLLKQPFFKEAFLNPKSLTDAFDQFCKSAIEGEPMPAHKAVHVIAQHRNVAIVTENVDLLHHRAGSAPIKPRPGMCEPDDVKAVQVVVCVGLSHDDRGFLAYCKKNNPEMIIIAIDKGNPDYLSNNDYIVREDVQVILPILVEYLCGRSKAVCKE
jgi:NAD-dependent SIR2 family protein deacetylase